MMIYIPIIDTVVGCPAVKPPLGAVAYRDDDTATIKCNNTQETWYLTCDGEKWIGTIGNCTGHCLILHSVQEMSWYFILISIVLLLEIERDCIISTLQAINMCVYNSYSLLGTYTGNHSTQEYILVSFNT